jgi:hypothetical protein
MYQAALTKPSYTEDEGGAQISMANPPKRLRAWVELAESEGWTYDETEEGHPRLTPPAMLIDNYTARLAAPMVFGKTPSDHRADANAVAYLRRLGVPIPHKGRTPKKEKR